MKNKLTIALVCAVLATAGCHKSNADAPRAPGLGEETVPAPPSRDEAAHAVVDNAPTALAPATASRIDDATLSANVVKALAADPELENAPIKVEARQGVVSLSGVVNTLAAVERAAKLAHAVDGVERVENQLSLMISQ